MTGVRNAWRGIETRPQRLVFAVVLAVGIGSGALPGFAYGVLGPLLLEEYGLSRSQLGLLTSATFLVGGATSLTAGDLVDRFGARRVLVGTVVAVGCSLVGMALIRSFATMVVLAGTSGVGLAAGNPTTNRLIAEHLPEGRRGTVMGVKQAGVQLTGFLAGAALGPAALAFGWRGALLAGAAAPLFAVVVILALIPADGPIGVAHRTSASRRAPLPASVRRLAAYAFLMGMGIAVVNTYLPLYAVEGIGLTPAVASALVAFMAVFGTMSRIGWGTVAGRSAHQHGILTGLAVAGSAAVGCVLLGQVVPGLVWVGTAMFGATAISWNTVGMLALLRSVPLGQTGRASGSLMLGFYAGFVPSPLAFGALVDATESYTLAWSLVSLVYLGAAGLIAPLMSGERVASAGAGLD